VVPDLTHLTFSDQISALS